MKQKEISRTATFAWSPSQQLPVIATGTVSGAFDATFSNTTELELFKLDLKKTDSVLHPCSAITSNARSGIGIMLVQFANACFSRCSDEPAAMHFASRFDFHDPIL
jgi:hypothetical protein